MRRTGLSFLSLLFTVVCVGQNQPRQLASQALRQLIERKGSNDSIEALLSAKNIAVLKGEKINILAQYQPSGIALARLTTAQLQTLLNQKDLLFADVRRNPKEELTTGALDINLNKISFSHHQFPTITGDSILASIKEQSFDSTDIDIKGRNFNSKVGSTTQSTHASIMATILGGAGNSSPHAKGAAWGSYLTSSDFATLLPDPDSIYRKFNISIQNHSYGTAIENYYGGDAAAYDQSSKNNPALLHVFSAGNVGNTASNTGPYAGLQGYANTTGSFKMSKNSIVVGATDSFNHVSTLSSKGPAYDGRVIPELVAFGEDGSSGAAALVSGTAALVQQAYKLIGQLSLPSNALVKAVLLNSAHDVESPNLDYASGYGALNAFDAVKTMVEKRYREDSVGQNEVKNIRVSIPQKTTLAKFTVSWSDVPALPNAAKALVNDVDMELERPSTGETWLPWVLNAANSLDSILLPAKRGRDTLNNSEQITIENPAAGDYVLHVKGSKIMAGTKQGFALAYQFDSAGSFQWTHPTSTEAMLSNTTNVIRWQTTIQDTASIDYSLNGQQWQSIATGVNLQNQYYKWQTPDTVSVVYLRIRVGNLQTSFTSDSFTFSRTINLKVGFNCPDSFLLYWNKLPVAHYQVYFLGQKYLQPLLITSDTLATFNKSQSTSLFYSVAPVVANKPGFRSFTINYTTQGVGCYVSSFLATLENNKAILHVQLGTVHGINSMQIVRVNGAGRAVVQTITSPSSTNFLVEDLNLLSGVNNYQLAITLSNGQIVFSNVEAVYYFPKHPVIVYPNPAWQQSPIQIIAQSPGEYTIEVYDANGRKTDSRLLDDISQQLPPLRLAKGLYFISITATNGSRFVQKLIVY